MSVLPQTLLLQYADKVGAAWELILATYGSAANVTPPPGTVRRLLQDAIAIPVDNDDVEPQLDLNAATLAAFGLAAAESAAAFLKGATDALAAHAAARGPGLDASITSLATYLAYLNDAVTGTPWSALVAYSYGDLLFAVAGSRLEPTLVLAPAISPLWNAVLYPAGMATRAVGGALTDGAAVDLTAYAPVELLAVVTADFVGGTAPPTLTISGADSAGAANTWNQALPGNNPVAAVATTITPPVLAWARQAVAVAAAAGIVRGSLLSVNAGLADQETVLVEDVTGSNITAVFKKAHAAGAALTGLLTVAVTPPAAAVRCADVSNLVINVTGHSAGAVRVEGRMDRVAV